MNQGILIVILGIVASFVLLQCTSAPDYSEGPPWFNPELDTEARLDSLLSAMTLDEKVGQMMNSAPAIERLGIPAYDWWNECLHGVARSGLATVFPQAIGMAAMWDEEQMLSLATVISDEARAKHHDYIRRGKHGIYEGLTFWTPNINIFRDPRWGRGMETYGEDPFLTGRLAVQFVKGLQGDDPKYLKTVATVKHFAVHSGPEFGRHYFDAVVSERDLRETYLDHFRRAIIESNAYSAMCAYNRLGGEACCGNNRLINKIMREEWGFEGYVVSDCGAIDDMWRRHKVVDTPAEAAALAVKSGTDLNCGSVYRALGEAVDKGLITEQEIDVAVRRLFRARIKLGMFDPAEIVPFAQTPYSVLDSDAHKQEALRVAQKSMVLLKNENNVLPLSKDIGTVAVIGPNADDVEVLLGNYNGIPSNPVTPLQGIREKIGDENVLYALGCEWAENLPVFELVPGSALKTNDGRSGLTAEIFNNNKFEGQPVAVRTDAVIDFNWWDGAPLDTLDDDNFGVRWSGTLTVPTDGWYVIGADGTNGYRIRLDGKQIVGYHNVHHAKKEYEQVLLKAGAEYALEVESYNFHGDAAIQLIWSKPGRDYKAEALAAAEKSDVVVMCMGLSPRLEGEEMKVEVKGFKGGDRLSFDLPDIQTDLMKSIAALGKPTVLVLLNGSAVSINWAAENIPAIVEAWYPGQAAGAAIADVLFGDYNPAGRLPITFYKSVHDLPPFEQYDMTGQTYRYFDKEPLFAFGHGLSYTSFEYSDMQLPAEIKGDEAFEVSVRIKNTGDRDGEEVVQLYVSDVEASVPTPIRSLKGFQRIALKSGEEKTVIFSLAPYDLSLLDKDSRRVVEPGEFLVSVGGKQPGTPRADEIEVVEGTIVVSKIAFLE